MGGQQFIFGQFYFLTCLGTFPNMILFPARKNAFFGNLGIFGTINTKLQYCGTLSFDFGEK